MAGAEAIGSGSLTPPAEPDGAPRIAVLDILRGIAILGILFMNINDMGASLYASFRDVRHLGWTGADQVAWWLREVLANGTARCLLEMLFGCGMVILTDRAAAAAANHWAVLRGYAWRNIVLFLFGVVHLILLLWPGEILHTYGLAALVAVLFRRLPWPGLLAVGLAMAVWQLGSSGYDQIDRRHRIADGEALIARHAAHAPLTKPEQARLAAYEKRLADRAKARAEDAAKVVAEDQARSAATGTFASWARAQIGVVMDIEGQGLELEFVWEAASTMLIGAALFRLGIIQGLRRRGFYLWLTIGCYAFGLTARALDAYAETRFDHAPHPIYAVYEFSRLATTLGHVGLVNLLLTTVAGARLLRPFAAAGRTALTLYIAQTLICLWVLYPPWGLGLYGRQGWAALMLTAAAVNGLLLVAANLYVRRFDIAPVEWAWRSIVAGRRLRWSRGSG